MGWRAAVAGAAVLCGGGFAVARASVPSRADPFEPLNRGLYAVHRGLEQVVVRPVLAVIAVALPRPVQRGLRNVIRNLGEPITAANDLLQLRPDRAATAAARFAANSTIGLLGLFDVAAERGLEPHDSRFGQTLAQYGVPPGPYLFVPLLGPSSVRDLGGAVVDATADPVNRLGLDTDHAVLAGRVVLGETDRPPAPPRADAYAAARDSYLDGLGAPRRQPAYAAAEPPPETDPETAAEQERRATFAAVSGTFFRPYP